MAHSGPSLVAGKPAMSSGVTGSYDYLDDAFNEWCGSTEPSTRLTVTGWPQRLDALAAFFPLGLKAGPQLAAPELRLDALYWMANALNLHGYPGRSLTAFGQHEELCREIGPSQARRLATAMASHAKSLRQCGRFHDADLLAREGLDLQRRVGDSVAIGVNLYWLGMGLSHRGDPTASDALNEAMKMLQDTDQSMVVATFSAQRALWENRFDEALLFGTEALVESTRREEDPDTIDLFGARKVRAASLRIVGESNVRLGNLDGGNTQLRSALQLAGDVRFVEEVLPALCALTMCALAQENLGEARRWIDATFQPAHQGPYPLYDCDAHIQLAELELRLGNPAVARSVAQRALLLAECDGGVFRYERGIAGASVLLSKI
jgi:tetratricopeptide (TPR) repeat protein